MNNQELQQWLENHKTRRVLFNLVMSTNSSFKNQLEGYSYEINDNELKIIFPESGTSTISIKEYEITSSENELRLKNDSVTVTIQLID